MMTFLLQKKQWVFHWNVGWFDLSLDFFRDGWGAESGERFGSMCDNDVLDVPALYRLVLLHFASQDYLEQSISLILQNSMRFGIPFVTTVAFSVLVE